MPTISKHPKNITYALLNFTFVSLYMKQIYFVTHLVVFPNVSNKTMQMHELTRPN